MCQCFGQDVLFVVGQFFVGVLQQVGVFGSSSYVGVVLGCFELMVDGIFQGLGLLFVMLCDVGFGLISIMVVGDVKFGGDFDLFVLGVLCLLFEQG